MTATVIDLEKARRFRELTRQIIVLEQDIAAKQDMLHRATSDLGTLTVELLHGVDLKIDRLNGESTLDG